MTIRQIVLFRFPEGPNAPLLARMSAGLAELRAAIPDISDASWGRDIGAVIGANADNAHFALVMDFAGPEALKRYKTHPAHLTFIEEYMRGVAMDRVRIQYELPEKFEGT